MNVGDFSKSNFTNDTNTMAKEFTFEEEFEKFAATHPQWKEDCVLFFSNYQHINHLKVLRKQKHGLCFMHAPVVLQHYLVAIYKSESSDLEMIDIAQYIYKYFKSETLLFYLLFDNGGQSMDFMTQINPHVPNLSFRRFYLDDFDVTSLHYTCGIIMTLLQSHPAMVSHFHVDSEFYSKGTSFLTNSIGRESVGLHSMILIGCRKCKEHQYVFLLQNWWEDRFFIEVSAAYLNKSGAVISFVDLSKGEIKSIPEAFPIMRARYAETNVDIGEKINEK